MVLQLSNGKYLHTAYAVSNIAEELTSEDWSLTDQEGMLYVGTYIDDSATDSSDPTNYNWEELLDGDVDDEDEDGIMPPADFQSQIDALADQMGIAQDDVANLQVDVDNINTNLDGASSSAESANRIAGNTNQYFWHTESGTDTGAHITEVPREEFLEDPENGGGNLLARSNGIAVRDGLEELSTFSADGATIGKANNGQLLLDSDSFSLIDKANGTAFSVKNTQSTTQGSVSKNIYDGVALVDSYEYVLADYVDNLSAHISFDYGMINRSNITIALADFGSWSATDLFTSETVASGTISFDSTTNTVTMAINSLTESLQYNLYFYVSYTGYPQFATMALGSKADTNGNNSFVIGAQDADINIFEVSRIGAVASLTNTSTSGATFRTTTNSISIPVEHGQYDTRESQVHSLSGYYPIAVQGWRFDGTHATWLNVYRCILSSVSLGSCVVSIGYRDLASTGSGTCTMYTTVLWAKHYTI